MLDRMTPDEEFAEAVAASAAAKRPGTTYAVRYRALPEPDARRDPDAVASDSAEALAQDAEGLGVGHADLRSADGGERADAVEAADVR